MKKTISIASIAILGLSFGGCAPKMIKASVEKDKYAKEFKTNPNKSNIYICKNENFGSRVNMPLIIDGKFIGKTDGHSFFYLTVVPGKHTIMSLTENIQTLLLNTEKNKNYFIWQEVKMGAWAADSKLHKVDANHKFGKNCILETYMLEENKNIKKHKNKNMFDNI